MKYRRFKRLMAAVLGAAMLVSMTACGNKQETPPQTQAQADNEEQTQLSEPEETGKTEIVITADTETTATINGLDDGLCSWTTGGTEAGTINGDDYSFSPVIYINGGAYDKEKSLVGDAATVTDTEMSNLSLTVEKVGVNGIIVNNSDYTIKDSTINLNAPEADGSLTCDFSGLGSAIAVYGQSKLHILNTEIYADGVANLAVFADNGSSALLENVKLHSDGGTLYEDYINSPNQGTMVAPPWILGIMGTSRGTNLMGDNSTMSVVDSEVSASNWAVLSTDSGSNMYLNVVNTTMNLTGNDEELQAGGLYSVANPYTDKNGYGTYIIGGAVETFLGTTMNVGTYASIFTGGTGYYGNLTAGESYDLLAADGSTHYTYTAAQDVKTVINSDTFGFMAHQGDNECTLDGVEVNSAYTGFVVKSGNNTTINVINGAQINAANGILLQLFDNDDSTTEFNPNDETVGMAFGTSHEEYAGFPTEAIDPTQSAGGGMPGGDMPGQDAPEGGMPGGDAPGGNMPGGDMPGGGMPQEQSGPNTTVYNVKDTDLVGAIYNGIGWNANALSQGNVKQMLLEVNLSGAATLTGSIASTSCIHATYEGQKYLKDNQITAFDNDADAARFAASYQSTLFQISEYFNICQVANMVRSNGLNDISVTVADNAVWTVTDTSLIQSLTVSQDAQVVVQEGATLRVKDAVYEAGTYTAADFQ